MESTMGCNKMDGRSLPLGPSVSITAPRSRFELGGFQAYTYQPRHLVCEETVWLGGTGSDEIDSYKCCA